MIELRKNPRANVTWRAAIELDDGNAIPLKVVNISSGSFLFHSPIALDANKTYRLMMEMPSIDQSSSLRYQVPCKVMLLHIRLSGDWYQVGARFTEISNLHQNLFDAWLSITTRFDQLA
ncbi:MAG: PilZ domain-containing protein [Undibacterium sp.]|nr:PilZ domain-containing protein [Undibacterium sp.]